MNKSAKRVVLHEERQFQVKNTKSNEKKPNSKKYEYPFGCKCCKVRKGIFKPPKR